jgi:hypothetical protein
MADMTRERLDEMSRAFDDMRARVAAGEVVDVGPNGCSCDFCTGKKRHEDNWCAWCGNVKLMPPKWWENCDACDACEKSMETEY